MRFLYLFPLLLLTACSNYYYAPNSHNVPLFKAKNEVRAEVKGITGDEFSGVEVQGAYSPAEHLGVIANFIYGGGGSSSGGGRGGNGFIGEAGVGYFTELAPMFVAEVYGGAGMGSVINRYDSETESRFNIMRAFVQPNIGFTHNIVDIAFSLRFCYLRYNNLRLSYPSNQYIPYYELLNITSNPDNILMEPALTIRLGWKYVKVQTQLTHSTNLTNRDIPMRNFTASLGLCFSLSNGF